MRSERRRFFQTRCDRRDRSFTFFQGRSINFAIVVYFECMHVEPRLAFEPNFGITEGNNMAKKAKKAKAKKAKKAAKKKKK